VTSLASSLTPTIAAFNLASGQPGFLIGGAAGFTYAVQASTNLLNWQNLYTNAPGSLPVPWTDTAAGGFAQRYYRVLLEP